MAKRPSTKPRTLTPSKSNFAKPGEIEFHGGRLIFVTKPKDDGLLRRIDLQSGDIGLSSGAPPVEICSEWTIETGAETIHEHTLPPPSLAECIVVNLEYAAHVAATKTSRK